MSLVYYFFGTQCIKVWTLVVVPTGDQQQFTISEFGKGLAEANSNRNALCSHPLPALTDN